MKILRNSLRKALVKLQL